MIAEVLLLWQYYKQEEYSSIFRSQVEHIWLAFISQLMIYKARTKSWREYKCAPPNLSFCCVTSDFVTSFSKLFSPSFLFRQMNAMLSFLERQYQSLLYSEMVMNGLFILSMRASRTAIENVLKFQIRNVGFSFWAKCSFKSYNYTTQRNELKLEDLHLFSSLHGSINFMC